MLVFVFAVMPIQFRASSGSQKDTPTQPFQFGRFGGKLRHWKCRKRFQVSECLRDGYSSLVVLRWVCGEL